MNSTSSISAVETGDWTIVKRKRNQKPNSPDDTQETISSAYENLKATQEAVALATNELKQLLKLDSKENISINLSVSPAGSPLASPIRTRSASPKSPIGAERPVRAADPVDFSPFYSRRLQIPDLLVRDYLYEMQAF